MPVKITKTKSGKYRVSTPHGVKAKGTSKKKALAQERLLEGMEHDPKFKAKMRAHQKSMPKKMFG